METFKRVLAVIAAILAVIGIIAGLLGIWFSWSYNTPVTESLVGVAEGAERVLAAAGDGLERVDNGLGLVKGAAQTVDETARTAGETIVDTSLAFVVLERTVGDTLFPRLLAAQETARSVAETLAAFNQTLEAANNLPFVELPTLTEELETAAGRIETARARVEEIQTDIRAIKEEKVAKPVAFVTDRTGPIIENLDEAQTTVQGVTARVDAALRQLSTLRERLPRLIDMASVGITLTLLWLIAAQGFVLVHAYEYLSGKRINWRGMTRRTPEDTVAQA